MDNVQLIYKSFWVEIKRKYVIENKNIFFFPDL